ncbi:DUF4263 domain-containing protein [Chryseobacterium daecheongense]|uniref:Shedu anti-phage system protein SduA domain-containing protein n=1 Tax=Chryseobacterium daecheongense TaxID=192389 RepID=UPI001FD6FEF8|nr:Shedu anti-phage system protein SduA domain-containing protein [Chryseobacterium daecheongense]UOU98534.1 DUF4263 domain-containing protein [Chryseobacterium daecheongense]
MLYKQDFRNLNNSDQKKSDLADKNLEKDKATNDGALSVNGLYSYWDVPTSVIHNRQLFPNNYLNTDDLKNPENIYKIESFSKLIEENKSEREILNHISHTESYFIIGSILQNFQFGHHNTFLFKEFPLFPNYVTDYLLIGKNSHGYHFVFIELENVFGNITINSGDFGTTIRNGLKQIQDWDFWLESNFNTLKVYFEKHLGKKTLPKEFINFDKTRINYVIVAGKRIDFNEKTYRLKRKLHQSENILLLHYDNLIEDSFSLLKYGNY